MTAVFKGERTFLSPVMKPVARGLYASFGTSAVEEQSWIGYAAGMLIFSTFGFLLL